MTLRDVVERVDELDGEDIMYVRRPWGATADCIVVRFDPATRATPGDGLDYFLEGSTAREVLEVFDGRAPTLEERLRLLIYYARTMRFDWVYES